MLFVCTISALTSKVGVGAKPFSLQLAAGRRRLVGVKLYASRSKKVYCVSICYFTFSSDVGSSTLSIVFYTFSL